MKLSSWDPSKPWPNDIWSFANIPEMKTTSAPWSVLGQITSDSARYLVAGLGWLHSKGRAVSSG